MIKICKRLFLYYYNKRSRLNSEPSEGSVSANYKYTELFSTVSEEEFMCSFLFVKKRPNIMNFPQEMKKNTEIKKHIKHPLLVFLNITSANYVIALTAACGTPFVQWVLGFKSDRVCTVCAWWSPRYKSQFLPNSFIISHLGLSAGPWQRATVI